MIEEPKTKELNGDENRPALKSDVTDLAQIVAKTMASKEDFNTLHKLIIDENKKTRRHFDVAVEKIEDDLKGANKDEVSLIKDQQIPDLDDRVQVLEKQVGVPVGSRHGSET